MAKAEVVPQHLVIKDMSAWKPSIETEFKAFFIKKCYKVADKAELKRIDAEKVSLLPMKMVFTIKPLSKAAQKAANTTNDWKRKCRMCICGNFAD
eukprot:4728562-Amphidinium_carterae.1